MKLTIILTSLLFSPMLYAWLPVPFEYSGEKITIGEEKVELQIVGSLNDHYFEGCKEKGFHLSAEQYRDTYRFNLHCGPAPENIKTYTVIREEGI